jgi:hypothetical protein
MLAPASAPTAPLTHAPLWPLTEFVDRGPTPADERAQYRSHPCARCAVESVPPASAVPSVADHQVS